MVSKEAEYSWDNSRVGRDTLGGYRIYLKPQLLELIL